MKILIAEDNADSRVYLERILKGNNYDTESAGNGLIAWNLAQLSPPDLIVSDILMPEMDGFTLCRQWKKDEMLKDIPFIFYTATYTDLKDKQLALSLGAERFVTKPQPPDVLLAIIREVLDETGAASTGVPALPLRQNGFFEEYNAVLFHKLEKKVLELEEEVTLRKKLAAELLADAEIAQRVQEALLSPVKKSAHVEVATIFHPYLYVGGDLYFLDWRHGGKLFRGFLLAATGHGLSRALYAAALHVMLRELNETDLPLAEQVRQLNRRITQHFTTGTTASGIAFELDLETQELRWVTAGLSKFWVSAKKGPGLLNKDGLPLGTHPDIAFTTHTLPLSIGDSFYFCTNASSDILEKRTTLPLNQYTEMVSLLRTSAISGECKDDATAVCIRIDSFPEIPVRLDGWPKIIHFVSYGDYQRFKNEITKILADITGKAHSLTEVAVNEALANAMECRDGVSRPHRVRLRFNVVGRRLIVRVKSNRMGFAGNAALRRLRSHPEEMFAFGEDASMGRGIPMMLSMSDYMKYNNDGTELLLAWKVCC